MSIEAVSWVLNHSRTSGNDRLVLIGLANHAHPDGSNSYPVVDTLARYAHVDRRTAQRRLRALEEGGHIVHEGVGPEGQKRWRIAGVDGGAADRRPGGEDAARGGGADAAQTVKGQPSKGAGGSAGAPDPRESLPADFPDELRPHARAVYRILREVAEDHGTKAVRPLALGRCIMANRRRPLVGTAHELHVWAADPPRPIRDVVATYRTFLSRQPELQATERLADDGTPSAARREAPSGVTPLRRHGAEGERAARQERRLAVARGDAPAGHVPEPNLLEGPS